MKSNSTFLKKQNLAGAAFLAPALLVLIIFLGIPVITAIFTSFTNADMLTPAKWIGFTNYINIIKSKEFLNSLIITGKFVLGSSIPVISLGLMLAVLLNDHFFGSQIFRLLIFVPVVLSDAIAALVWKVFLNSAGLFNHILITMGIIDKNIKWFYDSKYALLGMILFIIWKETGYFMVIFLAGLKNIPKECYEAAEVDGANSLQKLFFITLPLLKPTLLFSIIIVLIKMLNVFAPFFVITGGGPFNTTEVLPVLIYDMAFSFIKIGKASALSIIMLLIISVFSGIFFTTMGVSKDD
jgi:ABC-type sugar transport system permease subunit